MDRIVTDVAVVRHDDNRRFRRASFGGTLPEETTLPTSRTLASSLNAALADELLRRPELLLFGEDVGRKGGVYGVTGGLQKRFGQARVFDTLLDETSILGIAQGAAHAGLLPVPEVLEVHSTTGPGDLHARVIARNNEHLQEVSIHARPNHMFPGIAMDLPEAAF